MMKAAEEIEVMNSVIINVCIKTVEAEDVIQTFSWEDRDLNYSEQNEAQWSGEAQKK